MADFKQLQSLVDAYAKAGYQHIRVKDGDLEIEVSHTTTSESAQAQPVQAKDNDLTVSVTSPMVGIFHPAAGLAEGQTVQKGQELGQLESMKLFNPIKSPVNGQVVQLVIDHEQPVEYQQLLMELRREG